MLSKLEHKVLFYLTNCMGQENAMTSTQLAAMLNIDRRTVRQVVHSLREKGIAIASSSVGNKGYFIPATQEEANRCITQLKSRVKEISKIIRALENSNQIDGQMKLQSR